MPHGQSPVVISLTGERAERLAQRLLAPGSDAAEPLWEELAALGSRGSRLAHDWDPTTGRLTFVADVAGAAGA